MYRLAVIQSVRVEGSTYDGDETNAADGDTPKVRDTGDRNGKCCVWAML